MRGYTAMSVKCKVQYASDQSSIWSYTYSLILKIPSMRSLGKNPVLGKFVDELIILDLKFPERIPLRDMMHSDQLLKHFMFCWILHKQKIESRLPWNWYKRDIFRKKRRRILIVAIIAFVMTMIQHVCTFTRFTGGIWFYFFFDYMIV